MEIGALSNETSELYVNKDRRDELGELTRSFIAMVEAIKQKIHQNSLLLTDLKNSRDELEIKVQQRTQELEQLKQDAERLARIDPLTGLPNRRAFYEQARPALEQAIRYQRPFSVVMMDIDHFKLFNDTYGHDTGDLVLKAIAGQIEAVARNTDLPARFGGEEFVILLTETDIEAAKTFTERLRLHIEAMRIASAGQSLQISSSFGIAGCRLEDSNIDELIRRSDKALYQAKHRGRNCVVVIDQEDTAGLIKSH